MEAVADISGGMIGGSPPLEILVINFLTDNGEVVEVELHNRRGQDDSTPLSLSLPLLKTFL